MKLLHVAILVSVSSVASLAAAQESQTDAKWLDWGQQQVLKRDALEAPKAEQKWNDYGQQQVLKRMVPKNRRA